MENASPEAASSSGLTELAEEQLSKLEESEASKMSASEKICLSITVGLFLLAVGYSTGFLFAFPSILDAISKYPVAVAGVGTAGFAIFWFILQSALPSPHRDLFDFPFVAIVTGWLCFLWSHVNDGKVGVRDVVLMEHAQILVMLAAYALSFCLAFHSLNKKLFARVLAFAWWSIAINGIGVFVTMFLGALVGDLT